MKKILIFILCLLIELALFSAVFGIVDVGKKNDDDTEEMTSADDRFIGLDGVPADAYGKYTLLNGNSPIPAGNFYYLVDDDGEVNYFIAFDVSGLSFSEVYTNGGTLTFGDNILGEALWYSYDCKAWDGGPSINTDIGCEGEDYIYVSVYREESGADPLATYELIADAWDDSLFYVTFA